VKGVGIFPATANAEKEKLLNLPEEKKGGRASKARVGIGALWDEGGKFGEKD